MCICSADDPEKHKRGGREAVRRARVSRSVNTVGTCGLLDLSEGLGAGTTML